MRKGAFVLFVLLVNPLLTPSTSVLAQNYVQRFANGWIDWSNRIVEAVGVGTPPFDAINPAHARAVAKSGAESSARGSLLEVIGDVRIDSKHRVKEAIDQTEGLYQRLKGFLRNSQMVDLSYLEDGSVKATIALRLTGVFADLFLPSTKRRDSIND